MRREETGEKTNFPALYIPPPGFNLVQLITQERFIPETSNFEDK